MRPCQIASRGPSSEDRSPPTSTLPRLAKFEQSEMKEKTKGKNHKIRESIKVKGLRGQERINTE